MSVVSFLLMGENAEQYPPYKRSDVKRACEQTGYPFPKEDANEAELYEHALGFLDRLLTKRRRAISGCATGWMRSPSFGGH